MATVTQTFTTVGTTTWTVPNDVSIVSVFVVGGGGGGGGGSTGTSGGGGGGGAGGQVVSQSNISVVPGSSISVVVGGGGSGGPANVNGSSGGASSFGAVSAAGGGAGSVTIGAAGSGGGGASGGTSGGAVTGGNGGPGTLRQGVNYGAGGGGGVGPFTESTTRPLQAGQSPGPGQPSSGDGGDESSAAQSGDSSTGRGGGGGASKGVTVRYGTLTNYEPAPQPAPKITLNSQPGAAGGSGIVIVTYEQAIYNLSLLRDSANSSTVGIFETGTITVQLATRNVPNGQVVPFTISGLGIQASDFSPATLSGSFTVSSTDVGQTGTASVTLTLSGDTTLEGIENATLTLNNNQASIGFAIGDYSRPPLTNIESTTIRTVDYNNIRTKIISILGTGSLDYGYGQTVRSSAVDTSSIVKITEWTNLRYDIFNVWKHQFGELPSIADVRNSTPGSVDLGGNKIVASATQPYDQYENYANILLANRFGIHSSQAITRNGPDPSTPWIRTYTSTWTSRLSCTVTVSWPTSTNARYFFNCGGEIRFNSTRALGSITPQNTAWSTLLTTTGTQPFAGQKPGQLLSPLDGKNYYRLSNTPSVWLNQTASSPYGANSYIIKASTPDTVGSVKTITFLVEWIDNHTSDGAGSPDSVDGTLSLAVTTLEASGTYEPAGTGSFSVTSPTITLTNIV